MYRPRYSRRGVSTAASDQPTLDQFLTVRDITSDDLAQRLFDALTEKAKEKKYIHVPTLAALLRAVQHWRRGDREPDRNTIMVLADVLGTTEEERKNMFDASRDVFEAESEDGVSVSIGVRWLRAALEWAVANRKQIELPVRIELKKLASRLVVPKKLILGVGKKQSDAVDTNGQQESNR